MAGDRCPYILRGSRRTGPLDQSVALATAINIRAICIVAGLIGVLQRPKTIALAICGLGVTVGVVALLITVFGELFSLGSIFV
jgi:hypothetical protein